MSEKKQKFKMGVRQLAGNSDTLEIYLYGDIQEGYYDWWDDTYYADNSANRIKNELEKYQDAKTIHVYINSLGGDVFEGTAIANQLRRHPAEVYVTIDGFACSIASVIAMAGDYVIMPKNAVMMIHNMWTYAVGNSEQLRKIADDMDILMEANRTIYLEKSNGKLDEETLIRLLNEETYLTAEQCLEYGLCDQIESSKSIDDGLLKQQNQSLLKQLEKMKSTQSLIDEFISQRETKEDEVIEDEEKPKNYLDSFFE